MMNSSRVSLWVFFFGEFRFSKGVDENVNACFDFSLALQ